MPRYIYEALSARGDAVAGDIEADNVSHAIGQLQERGLTVESIRAVIVSSPPAAQAPGRSEFAQRLDASLAEREKLIPALEALAAETTSRGARHDLEQLIGMLKRGATADEFMRHESAASWLPLLAGGLSAESGHHGFLRFISQAARESESRNRRRRALAYPLAILALCLLLVFVLLVTVVPTFAAMFREFGLRLPMATTLVLRLSEELRERPLRSLAVLLIVFVIVVWLGRLWRSYALTTRIFGLFTAGNTGNVTAMARFTGTLAEMLSLGAPLADALRIAGQATQHHYFRSVAARLAGDVAGNRPLADSPVAHNLPGNVLRALHVGPEGRPSVALLAELSELYSDRVEERFDWSAQLVGPTAIVSIGLVVGFVVIALFMPLVTLITSLT